MNNNDLDLKYFAPKYLKETFEEKSYDIRPIKSDPGMKYLVNMIQQIEYFACKSLKQTSRKNQVKLVPSNMAMITSIH